MFIQQLTSFLIRLLVASRSWRRLAVISFWDRNDMPASGFSFIPSLAWTELSCNCSFLTLCSSTAFCDSNSETFTKTSKIQWWLITTAFCRRHSTSSILRCILTQVTNILVYSLKNNYFCCKKNALVVMYDWMRLELKCTHA